MDRGNAGTTAFDCEAYEQMRQPQEPGFRPRKRFGAHSYISTGAFGFEEQAAQSIMNERLLGWRKSAVL